MAATLFTRWLTMKSEQPVVEVSLEQAQFKQLMERLWNSLKQEFQHLALTVYMHSFNAEREVIKAIPTYSALSVVTACCILSGQ